MKKTATNQKRKPQSKPKAQKSITLMQSEEQITLKEQQERVLADTSFTPARASVAIAIKEEDGVHPQVSKGNGSKGSRYTQPKTQQRQARALITPEEYVYVKHDLMTIAIFTTVIIAGMIVLAFFIGIDM